MTTAVKERAVSVEVGSTVIGVAFFDSSELDKARADVVCTGYFDDVQLQAVGPSWQCPRNDTAS